MTSDRYVPALCLLLAIALVPTFIHSYSGEVPPDGRRTETIPTSLNGYNSVPSGREQNWGARRFDSTDWIERNYLNGGDEVRLTVIRSYDLKALYHHPELAVAYGPRFGSSFEGHEVIRPASRPELAVHVLRPSPGGNALGLYVLHYENTFVEAPLWFHLRTAGELLFSRRQQMTLFFAHDLSVPAGTDLEQLPSMSLLIGAIDRFLAPPR